MTVEYSAQYRREYKLAKKRGLPMHELDVVVTRLAAGEQLEAKYRDHPLTGNHIGERECHIRGNWLLVYKITKDRLVLKLLHTGTHSDIFGNSEQWRDER